MQKKQETEELRREGGFIHPSAIIDPSARIGEGVVIGPGCCIGKDSVLGDGCVLKANVIVHERVLMGKGNRCFPCCVLGEDPQILGQQDQATELVIGDGNTFREQVTINRGSPAGGGKTVVGNHNFMMIGSHLGHDCIVEDHVVIGNYCQFGGHSRIESRSWISGLSGTHQFVTIGRFAYAAGVSIMTCDIPPFMRVSGAYPCEVRCPNTIGLQRGGLSEESITSLKKAYQRLYLRKEGSFLERIRKMLDQDGLDENVKYLLEFLERSSQHRYRRYREQFRK